MLIKYSGKYVKIYFSMKITFFWMDKFDVRILTLLRRTPISQIVSRVPKPSAERRP